MIDHVIDQVIESNNKTLIPMDLERDTTDLVTREFLAVILAGFGNEYVRPICSVILLILSSCFQAPSTDQRSWR
jgi:hypothetical protein